MYRTAEQREIVRKKVRRKFWDNEYLSWCYVMCHKSVSEVTSAKVTVVSNIVHIIRLWYVQTYRGMSRWSCVTGGTTLWHYCWQCWQCQCGAVSSLCCRHLWWLSLCVFDEIPRCLSTLYQARLSHIQDFVCQWTSKCYHRHDHVCLSVCMSLCLSVFLSVCLSVFVSFNKTLCVSIRRSVITDMTMYVSLSVSLFLCLSVSLSVCLSLRLSVCVCVTQQDSHIQGSVCQWSDVQALSPDHDITIVTWCTLIHKIKSSSNARRV